MPVLEWRSTYPVSADELYAWHARPGAFERSAPPWQRLRVLERSGDIEDDGRVVLSLSRAPIYTTGLPDAVSLEPASSSFATTPVYLFP